MTGVSLLLAAILSSAFASTPSIPAEDATTIAKLQELGDKWEATCLTDARGEHGDPRSDRLAIQKVLVARDALRAELHIAPEDREVLWRRWWDQQTTWLIAKEWHCTNY